MNVNFGAFENHFGASALKRDYFDLDSGESIVMVFSNVELSSLAKSLLFASMMEYTKPLFDKLIQELSKTLNLNDEAVLYSEFKI